MHSAHLEPRRSANLKVSTLGFLASALVASCTFIAAIVPAIGIPGRPGTEPPLFPAPPGYLLPWAGGEIHQVTQGEETTFTHNGLTAYAFDFDLQLRNRRRRSIGQGGDGVRRLEQRRLQPHLLRTPTNYVVIDHGDGTIGLYLHLAYDSRDGEGRRPRRAGPADRDLRRDGRHLLGRRQRARAAPALPGRATRTGPLPHAVAADRVRRHLEEQRRAARRKLVRLGQLRAAAHPQKIKLTPYRVSREFNPKAVPLNADLIPIAPVDDIAPPPPPPDEPTATNTALPLAESLITPIPTSTRGAAETPTSTPVPASSTPVPPAPTDTPPPPTSTPTPLPPTNSPTPPPTSTSTEAPSPSPALTATPTP